MSIITVHPGDLIPWLTMGLFAGIRPDETLRLDWEEIDFEGRQIDLPAKKAKGRTRRIIPMEDNLIAWLKPCRPESGKGKICKNFRWKFRAFQKAAGEKWNPWPRDPGPQERTEELERCVWSQGLICTEFLGELIHDGLVAWTDGSHLDE
jgi:hypothetical protein